MKKLLITLIALGTLNGYAQDKTLECKIYNNGFENDMKIEVTGNKVTKVEIENHSGIGKYSPITEDSIFEQVPENYRFSRFRDLDSWKNRTRISVKANEECYFEAGICYRLKLNIREITDSTRNRFEGTMKLISRDSFVELREDKTKYDAYCKLL